MLPPNPSPFWFPFCIILKVFRDRFLNKCSNAFLTDFGTTWLPKAEYATPFLLPFFNPLPQETSLKVPWFVLAPFWLRIGYFCHPIGSMLMVFGTLLAPFWQRKSFLSAPESVKHLQTTADTLAERTLHDFCFATVFCIDF